MSHSLLPKRGGWRRGLDSWSLVLAVIFLLVPIAVTFAAFDPSWITTTNSALSAAAAYPQTFQGILIRNSAIALILYSGVITFGISTTLGAPFVAIYLGAFMRVEAASIGFGSLWARSGFYTVFEIVGYFAATAAGLLPISTTLPWRGTGESKGIRAYLLGAENSLRPLAVALIALVIGALAEYFTIRGA